MIRRFIFLFLIPLLAGCQAPVEPGEPARTTNNVTAATNDREDSALPIAWEIRDGVQAPESAYYDTASDSLYVSQIGGGGATGKDGDGYISKFTLDGAVTSLKWVTGLNAPKGLRSHEGVLWVADIDQLVSIDIAKGEIINKLDVPDAEFLNDVACGPDGTVYVSDMMPSRIVQCRDGEITIFAAGEELEHPNGLLVQDGRLIVAGWGSGIQDDFSTETAGRLFSLDLETKAKQLITEQPAGNLDGVEADGQGGYLVTDWYAGKVLRISSDGQIERLMQLAQGTADHAYVPAKHLLVLPRMVDNRVTAYKLGTD